MPLRRVVRPVVLILEGTVALFATTSLVTSAVELAAPPQLTVVPRRTRIPDAGADSFGPCAPIGTVRVERTQDGLEVESPAFPTAAVPDGELPIGEAIVRPGAFVLEGRVVADEDGAPIARARVELSGRSTFG